MRGDDRYELLSALGRGGMAEVHVALDRQTGERVALKVLRTEMPLAVVRRFERECEVLARLDHPGIVPLRDGGQLRDGRCYYTMPYLEGAVSLAAWCERATGSDPPALADPARVLAILADIAGALDHLHACSLTHRDVKPSNILVVPGPRERAMLIDFGLVGADRSSLTRAGAVLGTMAYLSPELARGEKVEGASDRYQLGLVVYELVTGRRACETAAAYLQALDEGRRPFRLPSEVRPEVRPALDEIVCRAADVDPARRYATAAEMVRALETVGTDRWYTSAVTPAALAGDVAALAARLSPGLLARYSLGTRLGSGQQGLVLLATDTKLRRSVAIKFLHVPVPAGAPEAAQRFEREARLLGRISHANVVTVFDMGCDGDVAYVVFEHLAGEPLAVAIAREAPLDEARVRGIALDVLRGLDALHGAGIVHRDIKPSNLLVTSGGVKIVDLGVAQAAEAIEEVTRAGRIVGTPAYMAPEQVMNRRVGPTADLYALGTVLYQCLTGALPFGGTSGRLVTAKIRIDAPPVESRAAGVGAGMAALVNRLVRRDPSRRPQSAAEAIAELAAIAPRRTRGTRRRQALSRPWWQTRRSRLAAALGLVGLAVGAIGLAVRRSTQPPNAASAASTGRFTMQAGTRAPRLARVRQGAVRATREPGGGLVVWLSTRTPVRCRLTVRSARGPRVLDPGPPERLDHRFLIPRDAMPVSHRFRLAYRRDDVPTPAVAAAAGPDGGEELSETISLDGEARRVFLEEALDWLAGHLDEHVGGPLTRAQRYDLWVVAEYGEFQKRIADLIAGLPPAWFLDEVGGPGGILDRPDMPPERKDRLYRSMVWLELLEAARDVYRVSAATPTARLYGAHFGPSPVSHYPDARAIPVVTPGVDASLPFELIDAPTGAGAIEFGRRAHWFLELAGGVRVDRIAPGSRAELHARARLWPGRYAECRINGRHVVRLSRPGPAFPAHRAADVYVAFDPAYLRAGANEIVFRCPRMPPVLESAEARRGVQVDPPGFTLRLLEPAARLTPAAR
jgi:serine/threonine protein kinase